MFLFSLHINQHFHGRFPVVINILICFQIILKYKGLGDQWAQMDSALIDQADSVYVIIVAVHHGTLDVQLVVVCHGRSTVAMSAKTATRTMTLPFLAYLMACPMVMLLPAQS